MSKIKKLYKGISSLIKKPSLINLILEDQDINKRKVIEKYGLKNGLPKIELSGLTDKTEHNISTFTFLEGGSLPTDYLLLKILAEKFSECTYFEIGTWRGESAVNVAEVANEVLTLNLSEEQMRMRNWGKKYIDLHGFFSKKNKSIKHLFGDSAEFDFSQWNKKCDLIFVDGDHRYDAVKRDTKNVFELRKNEKSIIVWHDYGMSTETTRWEVLLGILDGLPTSEHKNLYAVSNTLCAIYYPYTVKSFTPDFPATPSSNFSLKINFKRLG
jgi:predicted O-methyltransferase YrrM